MPIQSRQELGKRTWYRPFSVLDASSSRILVKWLGKDAINALAVDGKGSKADLLERVRRWVEARGRNVTHPGKFILMKSRNMFSYILQ